MENYNIPKGIVILIEESDEKINKKWILWLTNMIMLVIVIIFIYKISSNECKLNIKNKIKDPYYYDKLYVKYD